jgi:hypothetical protein
VTTEGWIFMVGLRVFDVGLLILWLVWFFRLRDDDDGSDDDGGGGGPRPKPDKRPGGGGLGKRIGTAVQGNSRLRDHRPSRRRERRRGAEPVPRPLPVRVRRSRPVVPGRRLA